MIKVQGINKSFGSLQVLKNIDLTITKGEIVSIVGPSGAGKTTLLQIMGTLDKPDSGKVIFEGNDVTKYGDRKLSDFRNKNIGFVFQFHQLLPEYTCFDWEKGSFSGNKRCQQHSRTDGPFRQEVS